MFSANLRQYESRTVNYSEEYILKNLVDLGGNELSFFSLFDTISSKKDLFSHIKRTKLNIFSRSRQTYIEKMISGEKIPENIHPLNYCK